MAPRDRAAQPAPVVGVATRTFTPRRVSGRALAARLLGETLRRLVESGCGSATHAACAETLGLSQQAFSRLCGDGDPAVALGDVLALRPTVARAVLAAALATTHEGERGSTRDSLDAVAIDLGEALRALRADLADGAEDHHDDHAARLERIAEIALRGAASARARAAGGSR